MLRWHRLTGTSGGMAEELPGSSRGGRRGRLGGNTGGQELVVTSRDAGDIGDSGELGITFPNQSINSTSEMSIGSSK